MSESKTFDNTSSSFQALVWKDEYLSLLDQRILPQKEEWVTCRTLSDVVSAIKDMVVRGAPAIGISACYAAYLGFRSVSEQYDDYEVPMKRLLLELEQARPTAVNLMWAVAQVRDILASVPKERVESELLAFAIQTHSQDLEDNKAMGRFALEFFNQESDAFSVLTHCNTGSLATGGYGTALGAIRAGYAAGVINFVYADETRPWLQGTRLTAWELAKDGIPFALNCDSAAAYLMKERSIKWVIVGADRVARNGDVANKIGTYSLAILSRYHKVRFMVVAPTSTIDISIATGDQINIETRDGAEITGTNSFNELEIKAENPVFDVTPSCLVDVLVTEKGAIEKPDSDKIKRLMAS